MKRKFQTLIIFQLLFTSIQCAFAQGDLMIMPKRLVFDGSQRSQEINLANTGKDTAIYAISFINYRMSENGNFEQIEEPDENQRFATDFLRYYPRRVTLAPNEAQTIRVQLTRTGNLKEGEYRSHMYFRAVEAQNALGEDEKTNSNAISISIKTVFGISVPVIIRHGVSTTKISLNNLDLDLSEETPKLAMNINRSGNMSVYGNITVEYISAEGKEIQAGLVKGISIYTPNIHRHFSMELQKLDGIDFKKGRLRITYTSDHDEELAVSTLNLNK